MPQPTLTATGQRMYDAVAPLARDVDEALGWPLAYYCGALATMFDQVADLASDQQDGSPGWSSLFLPDPAPVAVNLITNPSFEVDTSGWAINGTGGVNTAFAVEAANASSGSHSLRATYTGVPAFGGYAGAALASRIAATPGQALSASCVVTPRVNPSVVKLSLQFYNSSGGFISGVDSNTLAGTSQGTLSITNAVAPAATASVGVLIIAVNNLGSTQTVDFNADAVMVVASATLPPYFDGDSDGAYWEGAPHASASALLPQGATPAEFLAWIGQFVGVQMPAALNEAAQRLRLKSLDGFKRGTPDAIKAAAQQQLTGTKDVTLFERTKADGSADAYYFIVATYAAETPDPAAVLAALTDQKPAGLVMTYRTDPGWGIGQMETAYPAPPNTIATLEGAYATIANLEAHLP